MLGAAYIDLQGGGSIQFVLLYRGLLYFHFLKVLFLIVKEKTVKITVVNYTESWVFQMKKQLIV